MFGIYVHIPFCIRKCGYCDFFSMPVRKDRIPHDEYLRALRGQLEADVAGLDLGGRAVASIYFGGGTPSVMPPSFFSGVLEDLRGTFSVDDDAEISCEVNPATVDFEWFEEMSEIGVSRISIGIQSFNENLLGALGRAHTREDGMRAIAEAQDVGFDAVSIDLMFGIPGEGTPELEDDLKLAMTFQPEHISAYQLTVEKGTDLGRRVGGGEIVPVSEDGQLKQMRLVERVLGRVGWRRYEISNYAREGYECRHNLNYWRYGEYLGVGAGATSFIRASGDEGGTFGRRWTVAKEIGAYLKGRYELIERDEILIDKAMSEFCFLGLRTMDGIRKDDFEGMFSVEFETVYGDVSSRFVSDNLLLDDGGRLCLTKRGVELSNRVFEEFIVHGSAGSP